MSYRILPALLLSCVTCASALADKPFPAQTFATLKKLPCDIFLGAHGNYYGMHAKYDRIGKDAANPFLDPKGYQAYVADREQVFRTRLAEQQGK